MDENGIVHLTGSYHDVGTQDAHTITINWGEGSPQTFALSGGVFDIVHQYRDDNPSGTSSDVYTIEVTLTDDDTGSTSGSTPTTITNVAPVVSNFTGPNTGVRGQFLSFAGLFSDIGTVDTHTAVISWGDATSSTANVLESSGSGSVSGSHVYSAAGTYTVTVKVTDDDGGYTTKIAMVAVKAVDLQVDPCDSSKIALIVGGTTSNDKIEIKLGSANHPGKYEVNIANAAGTVQYKTDTGPTINRVIAYGLDGNDEIKVDTHGCNVPAWLFGGGGDDKLSGNIGDDVLDGGAGDDSIVGNGGRDLLIGGAGSDVLDASKGEDIMIGGSLNYGGEAYLSALCQIMDEWERNDTFNNRRVRLSGGMLNLLAHSQSDSAFDNLKGGSGSDWFLANITSSASDAILDKVDGFKSGIDWKDDI